MPVLSVKALEVNISEWIFHYQDEYLDLNDSGWSEELNKKKRYKYQQTDQAFTTLLLFWGIL